MLTHGTEKNKVYSDCGSSEKEFHQNNTSSYLTQCFCRPTRPWFDRFKCVYIVGGNKYGQT